MDEQHSHYQFDPGSNSWQHPAVRVCKGSALPSATQEIEPTPYRASLKGVTG